MVLIGGEGATERMGRPQKWVPTGKRGPGEVASWPGVHLGRMAATGSQSRGGDKGSGAEEKEEGEWIEHGHQ